MLKRKRSCASSDLAALQCGIAGSGSGTGLSLSPQAETCSLSSSTSPSIYASGGTSSISSSSIGTIGRPTANPPSATPSPHSHANNEAEEIEAKWVQGPSRGKGKKRQQYRIVGDTAELKLTHGKVSIIDKADLQRVLQHKWNASNVNGRGYYYVNANVDGSTERLHRFILGITDTQTLVDHIDGNTMDCRRSNMRTGDAKMNLNNQKLRNTNTTGVNGVKYIENRIKKFMAQWTEGDKRRSKSFHTLEEAAAFRKERDAETGCTNGVRDKDGKNDSSNDDECNHSWTQPTPLNSPATSSDDFNDCTCDSTSDNHYHDVKCALQGYRLTRCEHGVVFPVHGWNECRSCLEEEMEEDPTAGEENIPFLLGVTNDLYDSAACECNETQCQYHDTPALNAFHPPVGPCQDGHIWRRCGYTEDKAEQIYICLLCKQLSHE